MKVNVIVRELLHFKNKEHSFTIKKFHNAIFSRIGIVNQKVLINAYICVKNWAGSVVEKGGRGGGGSNWCRQFI